MPTDLRELVEGLHCSHASNGTDIPCVCCENMCKARAALLGVVEVCQPKPMVRNKAIMRAAILRIIERHLKGGGDAKD